MNFNEHLASVRTHLGESEQQLSNDLAAQSLIIREAANHLKATIEEALAKVSVLKGRDKIKGRYEE